MNPKTKRFLTRIFILLAAFEAGFLADRYCQRTVLSLPEEEQGMFAVEWEPDTMTGLSEEQTDGGAAGYRLTEEQGITRFHLGNRYIEKFQITYDCDQMVYAVWYVWEEGADTPVRIDDHNSSLISATTVDLNMAVDRMEICWSIDTSADSREDTAQEHEDTVLSSPLFLRNAVIINQYRINWFRILFVWVILGLAAFLWLERKWIASHLAAGYLAVALTIGTLMIVLLPANKVSWDEEMHFFHAYCVSHFGTEVKTNDILERLFVADKENWPYSLPVNPEERRQMNDSLNELVDTQEYMFSRGHALAGIYTFAYVPQAMGLRLGFLLHLPFTVTYQLGRFFGLLFFALIFAWAIHRIPVGKSVLAMIGLLPTPLFLMSVYSYDSFITALFALGFACFLEEYVNWQRKITWKGFFLMAGCFAIGSTPKAPYIPIILVLLLLPHEKFRDRRQEYLMKGIVMGAFLALMASFVLPEVISPDEVGDTRGGDTSDVSQIAYIMSDIPGFLKLIFTSILATLPGFLFGSEVFGAFAHLRVGMLETLIPLLVFLVLICEDKHVPCRQGRLSWPARTWILCLCAAVIGMVWLAMYLAFTPVGADTINGVQARYYLPLLLPVYLCVCPEQLRICVKEERLFMMTLAGSAAVTLLAVGMGMMGLCG